MTMNDCVTLNYGFQVLHQPVDVVLGDNSKQIYARAINGRNVAPETP